LLQCKTALKELLSGRIRFHAPHTKQTFFDSWSNYGFAKLRHRDLKNALLAPWSLKTNAASVSGKVAVTTLTSY